HALVELPQLLVADTGEGQRVEHHRYPAAPAEIGEAHGLAMLVSEFEIGGVLANLDRHGSSVSVRVASAPVRNGPRPGLVVDVRGVGEEHGIVSAWEGRDGSPTSRGLRSPHWSGTVPRSWPPPRRR